MFLVLEKKPWKIKANQFLWCFYCFLHDSLFSFLIIFLCVFTLVTRNQILTAKLIPSEFTLLSTEAEIIEEIKFCWQQSSSFLSSISEQMHLFFPPHTSVNIAFPKTVLFPFPFFFFNEPKQLETQETDWHINIRFKMLGMPTVQEEPCVTWHSLMKIFKLYLSSSHCFPLGIVNLGK